MFFDRITYAWIERLAGKTTWGTELQLFAIDSYILTKVRSTSESV